MSTEDSTKRCCKCEVFKPCSEFWTNPRSGDGLRYRCKECESPGHAERMAAKPIVPDGFKYCPGCERVRLCGEFRRRKSGRKAGMLAWKCTDCVNALARGRREQNLEKDKADKKAYYQRNRLKVIAKQKERDADRQEEIAAYQKKYREEHAEERRAYNKEYWPGHYAANREKYIEKGRERQQRLCQGHESRHKRSDVRKKLEEQGGRCYWCDEPLTDYYEVDHIVPVSKGGSDAPGNICCACFTCNRRKHNKMPWEFSDRLF